MFNLESAFQQTVFSPLLSAARDGDAKLVQRLVAAGAELNKREKGVTAVELAMVFQHQDTFDYLMARPDIELRDVMFVKVTQYLMGVNKIQSNTSKYFLKQLMEQHPLMDVNSLSNEEILQEFAEYRDTDAKFAWMPQ